MLYGLCKLYCFSTPKRYCKQLWWWWIKEAFKVCMKYLFIEKKLFILISPSLDLIYKLQHWPRAHFVSLFSFCVIMISKVSGKIWVETVPHSHALFQCELSNHQHFSFPFHTQDNFQVHLIYSAALSYNGFLSNEHQYTSELEIPITRFASKDMIMALRLSNYCDFF